MKEKPKYAIKKEIIIKFSPLTCSDCGTEENLKACFDETEVVLCKHCIQDRLDVFKEDEAQEDEVDTWENHVKEDHINHWRKNA